MSRSWRNPVHPGLTRRSTMLALGCLGCGQSWAMDAPKGKVVLSITGAIGRHNAADRADFDMAMLAALPQFSFTTQTPWYKAPKKFTGPLLRDVLSAAGATGKVLTAVAINDYRVEIPVEDAQKYPVVLARLMDDQPMPLRDKGPLFIIYPYDSSADLRNERYYGRSAWQLRSLVVK